MNKSLYAIALLSGIINLVSAFIFLLVDHNIFMAVICGLGVLCVGIIYRNAPQETKETSSDEVEVTTDFK